LQINPSGITEQSKREQRKRHTTLLCFLFTTTHKPQKLTFSMGYVWDMYETCMEYPPFI